MRVMWASVPPFAPTGYGDQTRIFTPRIRDAGHQVAISALVGLQWTGMDWDGIPIFPADHTGMGKRMLRHHVLEWGDGDLSSVQVISLFDVWPWVDPSKGGMVADFKGLRIAAWVPVDCDPVSPLTRAALDAFDVTPIAMSRFGEKALKDAGYSPLYVPHGVETDVLKPADNRALCKQQLGIDPDRFVVGMVAHNQGTNPPRKAFPQVLQAFAAFRDQHHDALLYLHTEVTGCLEGVNLLAMAETFGIPPDALAAVSQVRYHRGNITKAAMAKVYNAMDVLANPSYGEGFGLPIVEAQSCGTPVVVSHWTSMPELVGAGWSVGGQPWYNVASGSMWLDPSTEEIYTAFEKAYDARDNLELRSTAREFALQYDADKVMEEHWLPTLAALDAPREVGPLPNREMRRRQAKTKVGA